MVKALFDTNILIDYLSGNRAAKKEFSLYADKAISIITWMEVQIGADAPDQPAIDLFLSKFVVLPLDKEVSARAVALRRDNRIKLPDAIIWATAQVENRILVTRNSKDFPASHPGVRVPYAVQPM
jgi:predicted nucleic acid-binding protein